MRGRKRLRSVATWITALLLALFFGLLALPANATQADPADARMAPETAKPWLVPAATATPAAGTTRAPSSLDALGGDDYFAATASPAPTPVTLPAGLGGKDDATFSVLLIGTDAYATTDTGRSDTMILAQINVRTGELKLVSFLRDLYVKIPGYYQTRLNAAYVFGGAELLKETLLKNFGVTVDRTLAVNFSLMVELIDRLGGVKVEVSEKERIQLNSILKFYNTHNGFVEDDQLLYASGNQLLSGKQALCFSRIRKIDSDFQRVGRQRKVLTAVYKRARETDLFTLSAIALDFLPAVSTDLTAEDAVALVPLLMQLDTVSITGLTVPVSGGYEARYVSGMDVLVPNLTKNKNAISRFLQ
ncbi:MAG: LCP family protein [Eubacteriales bacterium]|nr:LCP family protein [Eubacteriales bacterium]